MEFLNNKSSKYYSLIRISYNKIIKGEADDLKNNFRIIIANAI